MLKGIWYLFLFLGLGLLAGFYWYASAIPNYVGNPNARDYADAIVVVTGSQGRIETGIDVLKNPNYSSRKLFISGVNKDTSRELLMQTFEIPPQLALCCLYLGHQARNTYGNAAEVAAWTDQHRANRIILVTADYHMKRSLVVLGGAMPGKTIIPYAVASRPADAPAWWSDPATLERYGLEYLKLLLAMTENALNARLTL